ncbi:hypothetical protein B0H19DRAFT_1060268 [Mycena capillaripes]|nr:hypothetical protein B0H19DRAFT_1060268 [Mycena capillaripes]
MYHSTGGKHSEYDIAVTVPRLTSELKVKPFNPPQQSAVGINQESNAGSLLTGWLNTCLRHLYTETKWLEPYICHSPTSSFIRKKWLGYVALSSVSSRSSLVDKSPDTWGVVAAHQRLVASGSRNSQAQ